MDTPLITIQVTLQRQILYLPLLCYYLIISCVFKTLYNRYLTCGGQRSRINLRGGQRRHAGTHLTNLLYTSLDTLLDTRRDGQSIHFSVLRVLVLREQD